MILRNISLAVFYTTILTPFLYCGEGDEKRNVRSLYCVSIPTTNLKEKLGKFTETAKYRRYDQHLWKPAELERCAQLLHKYPAPHYVSSRLAVVHAIEHITHSDTSCPSVPYGFLMLQFAISCMHPVRRTVSPKEIQKDELHW